MRKCCIPVTKTTNLHRLFHRYSISHAVQLQFKPKLMDTVHYQVLFNLMHTYYRLIEQIKSDCVKIADQQIINNIFLTHYPATLSIHS